MDRNHLRRVRKRHHNGPIVNDDNVLGFPPQRHPDDPGPGGGMEAEPDWTAQDARWLGAHAARRQVADLGRCLVPDHLLSAYDEGLALPVGTSASPGVLPEKIRRRLLRRLDGAQDGGDAPPVPVSIVSLLMRSDIGTATRYDATIADDARTVTLRDLRAEDLLTWEHLRPIAMDARMVLPPLTKSQAKQWLAVLRLAIEGAEVVPMEALGSEAVEVRDVIADILETAPWWEPSEDDPFPRGIVAIRQDDLVGWPRGQIVRRLRAECGTVGRIALRRACLALGLHAADWRFGDSYIRVWARKAAAL
jgi:hypothetical protein